MAQVLPDHRMNEVVSKLPGVGLRVEAAATKIGKKAERLLAGHRHAGHAFIEVEHYGTDSEVFLNDTRGKSAAMSIEYGHWVYNTYNGPVYVHGLYIIHRAAGIFR